MERLWYLSLEVLKTQLDTALSSLILPDLLWSGVGLGDTRGPLQRQLFCGSVLLPDLFDTYTHTSKRRPNLCWEVILLITTFSDSR